MFKIDHNTKHLSIYKNIFKNLNIQTKNFINQYDKIIFSIIFKIILYKLCCKLRNLI